jgi:hypothetical protein
MADLTLSSGTIVPALFWRLSAVIIILSSLYLKEKFNKFDN